MERIGTKSKLVIKKEATEFELEQLSDGEKMLLLLVCDIARRLTIARALQSTEKIKPLLSKQHSLLFHNSHPQKQREPPKATPCFSSSTSHDKGVEPNH